MATSVIRNFIAKALFKKKGAIASSKAVDFSANALEQRLKNIGVDPNAITSENELNQILSYVKQAEDQAFNQNFGNMLGGSKFDRVGEVFDMTGKKLDSSRGTLGGTQIDENTLKEGLMKTDNPFSDLVKTTDQGPKTLAEREAEVLARLEKENKEAAQRIRDRKKLDDPEDMATGGRAGFKMGRRAFLKLMGGVGAGIGAAKTGLLKLAGKEPVKQVAKEVVQQSTTTPPPYFFKLADKIKKFGSDTTPTNDRTIAKSLKSKDGSSDYILEEDLTSGDTIIKKVNKEGDEMITDVEIMEFRKGEVVQGKDGRAIKTPDQYDEVTEANARIEGDVFNDPYYSDGIEIDDILREVDDIPVPKAGGGIARMLGE